MDHETAAGEPRLNRQGRPVRLDASGRQLAPQRVPETRPTPLGEAFIQLSIVVLVCGLAAITALEMGTPPSSLLVKVPVLIGGMVLLTVTSDAIVRVWRAAQAWLPVDRDRGLFRLVWVAVLAGSLPVTLAVMWLVLTA